MSFPIEGLENLGALDRYLCFPNGHSQVAPFVERKKTLLNFISNTIIQNTKKKIQKKYNALVVSPPLDT